jgi:predicted house-cleaning NTP pyrophosphatase (Maf/HAM1 superfamily)
MAASWDDISSWFDAGVTQGASHMIVVCDTFEYEDYPVYVRPESTSDARKVAEEHSKNMQRVMECYVLDPSRKQAQLSERRAHHYEPYTPSPTPPPQR